LDIEYRAYRNLTALKKVFIKKLAILATLNASRETSNTAAATSQEMSDKVIGIVQAATTAAGGGGGGAVVDLLGGAVLKEAENEIINQITAEVRRRKRE
jgi:hypothetical protein